MSNNDVYIVAATRTAIGNFNGTYGNVKASELGSAVIKELLQRTSIPADQIDEVILGQALTAGQGQNPARQAAINAGLPISTIAYNLNLLCGSGLKAVVLAYQAIRAGDAQIVIAGGQESMSQAPHVMHLRQAHRLGPKPMIDSMVHDGLTDAFHNIHMGITAENLAERYKIDREAQDQFALKSQQKALKAQESGYFKEEIAACPVMTAKGSITLSTDEFVKQDASIEGLQKLKAVFKANGTVTPGNASGINDAAAAVMVMSAAEVAKRNIKPMARIVAWSQAGCEPDVMGIGPVYAVQSLLKKTGWRMEDVDLFELNEAFAAQSIAVNQELALNVEKVNVHGGSIALGHPIGASGCRVLVTLLYALKRTGGKRGITSLCIGGGMGIAMAVEMI